MCVHNHQTDTDQYVCDNLVIQNNETMAHNARRAQNSAATGPGLCAALQYIQNTCPGLSCSTADSASVHTRCTSYLEASAHRQRCGQIYSKNNGGPPGGKATITATFIVQRGSFSVSATTNCWTLRTLSFTHLNPDISVFFFLIAERLSGPLYDVGVCGGWQVAPGAAGGGGGEYNNVGDP